MSRVITMMNTSNDVVILTPALRTAGNIFTGTDAQTEIMLVRQRYGVSYKKFCLFLSFHFFKSLCLSVLTWRRYEG